MKRTSLWVVGVLLACALVAPGCKKTAAQSDNPTLDVNGVKVELPRLQKTLASSTSQDVQNNVSQVVFGLRYGDYTKALMALDKLSSDPSLNEQQKKVVADVIEEMKQVINKTPAKP
jgi:hypothetical protein